MGILVLLDFEGYLILMLFKKELNDVGKNILNM